ncbi:MAG: hypothetical protein GF383_09770 [Candidatus Lokiarchaeota archaeon]|nr:hypothetical protein [Candidatus Lokiarchaeota archaeon]MBD3340811.1 hypothetical protein [Candidatus Lokiarchaeota archaeon]
MTETLYKWVLMEEKNRLWEVFKSIIFFSSLIYSVLVSIATLPKVVNSVFAFLEERNSRTVEEVFANLKGLFGLKDDFNDLIAYFKEKKDEFENFVNMTRANNGDRSNDVIATPDHERIERAKMTYFRGLLIQCRESLMLTLSEDHIKDLLANLQKRNIIGEINAQLHFCPICGLWVCNTHFNKERDLYLL